MASQQQLVLEALKALAQAALPGRQVIGLDADEAKPESVPTDGLFIIRPGDPGTPDVDLSPPTWHFEHAIPFELGIYQVPGITAQAELDLLAGSVGRAIAANRTLGGLCTWLDVSALTHSGSDARGARPLAWADFTITALYSTTSPLG